MIDILRDLVSQLNYHRYLYYENSTPVISDEAYDALYKKYLNLCQEQPNIIDQNPDLVVGVGYDPASRIFNKINHLEPMLSLKKIISLDDLQFQLDKWGTDTKLNVQPKIDGVSLSLTYNNGVLLRAVTRGNGKTGDDVTHNVINIKNIPYQIPFNEHIEIRGEVYIPKSVFIKVQEKYPELKNERNATSGSLRQKDPNQSADRGLHFLAYDIIAATQLDYNDIITNLEKLGFITPPCFIINPNELTNTLDQIQEINKNVLDYRTDGAVIKVDSYIKRKQLGNNTNWPEWAFAFKFETETVITKLVDVEWNVGKTGAVTPVGYVEPVELAGATVKKASLCNLDELRRLNIKIGSDVLIKRSNEVIPKIIEVVNNQNSNDISIPESCPSCNHSLIIDGPRLLCPNSKSCPDQVLGKIYHAACIFEVDNLGDKQIKKMMDLGYLKTPFDLLNIDTSHLLQMDNVKDKQANRLYLSLEKAKNNLNAEKILRACNIPNLGSRSEKLLEYYELEQIPNLTVSDLNQLEGFGDIIAENILGWFNDEDNLDLYNSFVSFLRKTKGFKSIKKEIKSDVLNNQSFLVTGTLPNFKRDEVHELIKSYGGKVASGVSSKLDYLITGEAAGSKLEKAQKLNIKIINEDQFKQLIGL